jgi:Peptidase family M28
MPSSNQQRRRARIITVLVLVFASSCSAVQNPSTPASNVQLTGDMRAAMNAISADSLRDHLKFIASDELQGRNTPSPDLDRAADYIAASFKKAGLEAAGDDGYFQTAKWVQMVRNPKGFALSIQSDSDTVNIQGSQVSFTFSGALSLSKVPLVKIDFNNTAAQAELKQSDLEGKAVITELPDIQRADRARRGELLQAQRTFSSLMQSLKATVIVSLDRNGTAGNGFTPGRLTDPENRPPQIPAQTPTPPTLPLVQLIGPEAIKMFDALPMGATSAALSLNVDAPAEVPVKMRNVIGVLRGSDPALRDTYVMVTAHYDHLGANPNVAGPDKIFNGANDDGSGTVSVMELAAALSKLKSKPKRSIVFMTVFGEEKGLLGSRYYGRHPVFPIEKTVADVNLEQVGRTDDSEGPQVGTCAMTGFDFSDVGEIFKAAGDAVGVKVFKHPTNSDAYFSRSDNQALADQGVPAHTLSVAYEYPDYHKVGDSWDKIDYDNMAKVDRMVAVGLLMIANNPAEPKWNEANPKTARYVKAWQDHHPK